MKNQGNVSPHDDSLTMKLTHTEIDKVTEEDFKSCLVKK